MAITSSMGTHKLYTRKGDRTNWVDYSGTLDATAYSAAVNVVAGRVFSLTSGGKLEPGLPVAKTPFFALSGLDANNYPDVKRDRGMPRAGAVQFATISAFAAVEMVTTEIAPDVTYTVGAALTAVTNAAGATKDLYRGLIIPRTNGNVVSATLGTFVSALTDPVVGFVAPAGLFTDVDGNKVLAFYPAYIPGSTAAVQP